MEPDWGFVVVLSFSIVCIVVALAVTIRDEIDYRQWRKAARRPVTLTPREPAPLTKAQRHEEQLRLWDKAFEATSQLTRH